MIGRLSDFGSTLLVFKIDRLNSALQNHFKRMCGEDPSIDIRMWRLTKRNLRYFVADKFTQRIADKFVAPMDMVMAYDFNEFWNIFNKLINFDHSTLVRIGFNIFDEDGDK